MGKLLKLSSGLCEISQCLEKDATKDFPLLKAPNNAMHYAKLNMKSRHEIGMLRGSESEIFANQTMGYGYDLCQ